jgi:hypothetical protein
MFRLAKLLNLLDETSIPLLEGLLHWGVRQQASLVLCAFLLTLCVPPVLAQSIAGSSVGRSPMSNGDSGFSRYDSPLISQYQYPPASATTP